MTYNDLQISEKLFKSKLHKCTFDLQRNISQQ